LRLQQEIKKTIIFVTHDIDEAIKMGDRIAILRQKSVIAQYDTPERILTDPADDFVEDFIGSGASIKRLSLSQVRDIETTDWPVTNLSDGPDAARAKLRDSGRDHVLLLDGRRHPKRWVSGDDLEAGSDLGDGLEGAGWPAVAVVEDSSSLYYTLDTMITSYKGTAIVVDDDGAYLGVVDFDTVLEAINTMRPPERPPEEERTAEEEEEEEVAP
jgi:osmoprotectant transport system ATP-binding protein